MRHCVLCGEITTGAVVCPGGCKPAEMAQPEPAPEARQGHTLARFNVPARMKCGCPVSPGVPAYLAGSMTCSRCSTGCTKPNSPEAMEVVRGVVARELEKAPNGRLRPRKGATNG